MKQNNERRYKNMEFVCPVCHQDMETEPKPGLDGKDCHQCGQGLRWRYADKIKRLAARSAGEKGE